MSLPYSPTMHMPYQAGELMDLHAQGLSPLISPIPLSQFFSTLPGRAKIPYLYSFSPTSSGT